MGGHTRTLTASARTCSIYGEVHEEGAKKRSQIREKIMDAFECDKQRE